LAPTPQPTATQGPSCPGDCDGDGDVTISELIKAVAIALRDKPWEECPSADANGDGDVSVDELVRAVRAALDGCTTG
jgi:hypothetical protein